VRAIVFPQRKPPFPVHAAVARRRSIARRRNARTRAAPPSSLSVSSIVLSVWSKRVDPLVWGVAAGRQSRSGFHLDDRSPVATAAL
jgi:hypothetical protein